MTVEYLGSKQAHVWKIVKVHPEITIPEILKLEKVSDYGRYTDYYLALKGMEKYGFVERVHNTRPAKWKVKE